MATAKRTEARPLQGRARVPMVEALLEAKGRSANSLLWVTLWNFERVADAERDKGIRP